MKEQLTQLSSNDLRQNPEFFQVRSSFEGITRIADELDQSVVGQRNATEAIARAVIRAESGLSDPDKPQFTSLFLGPTGVGKTESAKALAKYLHPKGDWKEHFIRIDCAQYKQDHDVHRLTGAPPSYVGYGDALVIPEEFGNKQNTVLLIDEVDQASAGFHDWLYSVLDEGEFKARAGGRGAEEKTINLRNAYVVLTSNVGAEEIQQARRGKRGLGFGAGARFGDIDQAGIKALEDRFRAKPAMLGRIDSIVVFNELELPHYEAIFNKYMDEINESQRLGFNYYAVTRELRAELLKRATSDGKYGGRDIRHTVDKFLLSKLAELKWEGVLADGQPVIGDIEDDEVIFWTSDLRLDDERKEREGRYVKRPDINGNIVPIERKKKKPVIDAGSRIGNRPDSNPQPPAENTPVSNFYSAHAGDPTGTLIDLYVRVKKPEGNESAMVFNVVLGEETP